MRSSFANTITELAKVDERVVLLSGDIGNRMFDDFKKVAPERFYNCGIAEANMIGVAAGLALNGFRPFVYTIAPFATVRCLEQIRVDLCYHNLPVTIVGTGSGLSYAELGPTHQMLEDISLLRSFPNMNIVCPSDPLETENIVKQSLGLKGPLYIRLGKKGEPILHKHSFHLGESITIQAGDNACIISTGTSLGNVIEIGESLKNQSFDVRVEHFHTVKPIDAEKLEFIFNKYELVIVIEEHSKIGGLGSIVAEHYVDGDYPKVKLLRFGTEDKYLSSIGDKSYLLNEYGLNYGEILEKIKFELR